MWAVAGSECRTIELYRLLRPSAEVSIWSGYATDPRLASQVPIQPIRPGRLRFPRGGTLVFVGVYYRYGRWVHLSGATRRIIVYNSAHPHILRRRIRKLTSFGTHRVEVVFASRWLQEQSGVEGRVKVSPLDTDRFVPRVNPPARNRFTVGRLSRDQLEKHNARDPALYAALASAGVAIRIMGGDSLRVRGPLDERIELLPECAEDPVRFLHKLDCFVYRTDDGWREPHGRVVQEAMACGLPVVCARSVGAAACIDHGRNGFLFDRNREALEILQRLRADAGLRARVGSEARRTIERLFSLASVRALADYYLRDQEPSPSAAPFSTLPRRAV
jgi:glycosyltransferase involved in cell wall biosynthesis